MQILGSIHDDSKGVTPNSHISMIAKSYSHQIVGHSNRNGIDSSKEVAHDIAEQEDPYSNLLTLTRTVLLLATFRLRSDRQGLEEVDWTTCWLSCGATTATSRRIDVREFEERRRGTGGALQG
jgi:hypothetical protein